MENSAYVSIIAVTVVIISFILLRSRFKVANALVDLTIELKSVTDVNVFCREIKKIHLSDLKKLDGEEKEDMIRYLKHIDDYLQLNALLSAMAYYKLNSKKIEFITDYLFQAIGLQGSAFILASIIYGEALGMKGNEREKKFILDRCGKILEFQETTIKRLETYQKSPLTKGFEASAIGKEMQKLQTQFTEKN